MAVSKRLRYEIMRRDNHACRYCGATAPDVKLTVDHVTPVALGGSDDPSNLVTACADCNSGKSASSPDSPLVQDVSQTALRWAEAMRDASEFVIGSDRALRDQYRQAFFDRWNSWTYDDRGTARTFPLPNSWRFTVDALVRAGLRKEDLTDAINECMYRDGVEDRFKYTCGIAWKIAKQIQQAALELVEDQENDDPEEQRLYTEARNVLDALPPDLVGAYTQFLKVEWARVNGSHEPSHLELLGGVAATASKTRRVLFGEAN